MNLHIQNLYSEMMAYARHIGVKDTDEILFAKLVVILFHNQHFCCDEIKNYDYKYNTFEKPCYMSRRNIRMVQSLLVKDFETMPEYNKHTFCIFYNLFDEDYGILPLNQDELNTVIEWLKNEQANNL